MIHAKPEIVWLHYPSDRVEFITGMGNKSLENYAKFGISAQDHFWTQDPHSIWLVIRDWLIEMMTSDLIFVTVWEWPHAIEIIRKIVWHTLPVMAAPGTIRWDYWYDSAYLASMSRRPIDNLIHASWSVEEAAYELSLWFPELQ